MKKISPLSYRGFSPLFLFFFLSFIDVGLKSIFMKYNEWYGLKCVIVSDRLILYFDLKIF